MRRRQFIKTTAMAGLVMAMTGILFAEGGSTEKPNVIIIMTDDMGFSDIGCNGSEIETPNLDMLAKQGLRFTQFYNEGICVPTRVSLLTGLHAKQTGNNSNGKKYLSKHSVTLAEAIGPAGYRTYHTGKWMVGHEEKSMWPVGRGFDHSYGCPEGGGFYFAPSAFYANYYADSRGERSVARDSEIIYDFKTDPPKGWFSTDAWTEEGIEFVREAVAMNQPFCGTWPIMHRTGHSRQSRKISPNTVANTRSAGIRCGNNVTSV